MVFNSCGRLRSVLLCEPTYYEICAFSDVARQHIAEGFKVSNEKATEQHRQFVKVFEDLGIEVCWEVAQPGHPDQVATRDFGVNTAKGVLIGRFRYSDNEGDEDLAIEALERIGIPMAGKVAEGALEGGDCWYLDENTLVIGVGNRSTMEGVQAATAILEPLGIQVIPVQFDPKWNHLDMIMSVVGPKTIMICVEALPDDFIDFLRRRKYEFIEIPPEEVFAGSVNVLALGDGKVLSFEENVVGNKKLKEAGIEVLDPPLSQFIMSGTGPHCLSFELVRDR